MQTIRDDPEMLIRPPLDGSVTRDVGVQSSRGAQMPASPRLSTHLPRARALWRERRQVLVVGSHAHESCPVGRSLQSRSALHEKSQASSYMSSSPKSPDVRLRFAPSAAPRRSIFIRHAFSERPSMPRFLANTHESGHSPRRRKGTCARPRQSGGVAAAAEQDRARQSDPHEDVSCHAQKYPWSLVPGRCGCVESGHLGRPPGWRLFDAEHELHEGIDQSEVRRVLDAAELRLVAQIEPLCALVRASGVVAS